MSATLHSALQEFANSSYVAIQEIREFGRVNATPGEKDALIDTDGAQEAMSSDTKPENKEWVAKLNQPFRPCNGYCPRLTTLIVIAFFFHLITLASFVGVYSSQAAADVLSLPVMWGQVYTNVTAASNGTQFYNYDYRAEQWITKVDVAWYAFIFVGLTCVEHLAEIALQQFGGENSFIVWQIGKGRNVIKWVFYTLSAPFMLVAITHMTGVFEFAPLFATWGLVAAVMLGGLCIDFIPFDRNKKTARWVVFFSGWVPLVFAWIVPIIAILRVSGIPDFVKALIGTEFFLFASFGFNSGAYLAGWYTDAPCWLACLVSDVGDYGPVGDETKKQLNRDRIAYARYTYIDVVLSFVAKFILPLIVFVGSVGRSVPLPIPGT